MPTPVLLRLLLGLLVASLAGGCRRAPTPEAAAPSPLIGGGTDTELLLETPAFPGWAKACGEGEAQACYRLFSSIMNAGRLDVARAPETLAGFDRGCEAGIGDACGGAVLTRSLMAEAFPGPEAFTPACDLGSPWSCALRVSAAVNGAPDADARAKEAVGARRRCHSHGDACVALSELAATTPGLGDGVAGKALRTGCGLGDSLSCFRLGQQLISEVAPIVFPDSESHSPEDAAKLAQARGHLTTACDHDIGPACHLLALQLFRGDGGRADPSQARARSRQACALGAREACDFLATTRHGRNYPPLGGFSSYPDGASFAEAQARYCGLGGIQACVELAKVRLNEGMSAPTLAPIDEAFALLTRTCEAQNEDACQTLLGVIGTATASCASDRVEGFCLLSGAILRRGLTLPSSIGETIDADPARARDALQVACQAGLQAGCAELKSDGDGDTP